MDKFLDKFDPSISEVKDWAYDENLYFIEQDEDLVLHSTKYITALMELASDPNCPKGDYCLSILSYYSQILLAKRLVDEVIKARQQMLEYNLPLIGKVQKWRTDFLNLVDLISNPRPIDEIEADQIARQLIVGDYRILEFKKLGILHFGIFEYSASAINYIEYLYINPKTANWKLSKFNRLSDISEI
ncbi:hypothetical protein QTN47_19375 [Danxiaibacter flavus]|uniref:Uncharacterized protein n=1 Tax=Danxiaibacter flavus TaxID=3049108 RepID=A0ABV3ZJC7_9BACT|nr:hypothetical protein QNM32_19385 [Chitinophagaceae bacterium DXS]